MPLVRSAIYSCFYNFYYFLAVPNSLLGSSSTSLSLFLFFVSRVCFIFPFLFLKASFIFTFLFRLFSLFLLFYLLFASNPIIRLFSSTLLLLFLHFISSTHTRSEPKNDTATAGHARHCKAGANNRNQSRRNMRTPRRRVGSRTRRI